MSENILIHTSDIKPLRILCQRMVESQESIATNEIVDTLEEQALLEALLEKSKPNLPNAALGLHYLLATPFRYPPLKWGSRFGVLNERGIFYGSLETRTLLHEVAYYTFVFLNGLLSPLPKPLKTRHTQFSVVLQADRAVLLNNPKFDDIQSRLRHLSDYTFTQQLGSHMRAVGVQAFLFYSARDPDNGLNAGVFDPSCFTGQEPRGEREWFCQVDQSADEITFYCPATKQSAQFSAGLYRVNGVLPMPA